MMNSANASGYSAQIQLQLVCNGKTIQLSHTCSNWVIPQFGCELPICEAEVIVHVDDAEFRMPVLLTHGMTVESKGERVLIRALKRLVRYTEE